MIIQKSWNEANVECVCQSEKAELVDIKSEEEDKFVKTLIDGEDTWLGLSDSKIEQAWTWTLDNDTTYFYQNWESPPSENINKVF